MPTQHVQALLVIGPSWVGDMVMAQSLFRVLKDQQPDRAIDVLAPAWTRPLLERMPEVRKSIDMPVGHGQLRLGKRIQLARGLRGHYRQAIVLPNSLKSALIPWLARIPKRTGWRGEMRYGLLNDMRVLDEAAYPLMVQRFVALALPRGTPLPEPLPIPQLAAHSTRVAELLGKFHLSRFQPVLALCPGAEFGAAKRWPVAHYAAVARDRINAGWHVWLLGSANDRGVCDDIVASLSGEQQARCSNLAGKTELADAIDLLSVADAVISNDSGLMHIAAALRRPLVAIYGSTSPDFTPPLSKAVAIESIPVECGPCFQRECPLGHLKCLRDLAPLQVLESLNHLLSQQKAHASTDR